MGKKILSSDVVIVPRESLPVLDANPIDETGTYYSRLEKLTSWFVLRAPLGDVTKLANLALIENYQSDTDPKQGSRAQNKSAFDGAFLAPLSIDCTNFEFVYRRREAKVALEELGLASNDDDDVFSSFEERGVFFVGSPKGKEDSCIVSVCRHIRNALAHGRIAVKSHGGVPYLFIEDGCTASNIDWQGTKLPGHKLEIRARAVISMETLEKWHSILAGES